MTDSKSNYRLLVKNAAQLVQVTNNKELFKTKAEMNEVCVIENGAFVVDNEGKIVSIGQTEAILEEFKAAKFEQVIDATNKAILPGFVDSHTHSVFSGDRCPEFAMKLAGATYMDIHKMGGGIGFTVRHVHESTEEELYDLLVPRLNRMIKQGTTLVEVKSGYGLDTENEIKMLKVIEKANKNLPIDIVANFCGAHSVPKGSDSATAMKDIIENQIPKVIELKNKGEINPELIDVFCEKGVFELKESEEILKAGLKVGLKANFHGDELTPIKAAEMGSRLGALGIAHLEHISDEGIKAMAEAHVVGVVLPTTAYILRIEQAPARKMIEGGVPLAIATDYNPNAHCLSMPFVMNLSCIALRLTMNEALVSSTINAAASLGKSDLYGSLEAGKFADFVVLDFPKWEHLIYEIVDPPIQSVWKKGVQI